MMTNALAGLLTRHNMESFACRVLPDARVRASAVFRTEGDALTYKAQGAGGWVLGRYWYDATHTASQVMRECPASGVLQ